MLVVVSCVPCVDLEPLKLEVLFVEIPGVSLLFRGRNTAGNFYK